MMMTQCVKSVTVRERGNCSTGKICVNDASVPSASVCIIEFHYIDHFYMEMLGLVWCYLLFAFYFLTTPITT